VAVLLYHAGVPFARGGYVGVDVFFVISGFLITGLLVRELEKTGTVSLSRFYSRRAKRLLPLTVVVLAFVVALSWLLFDPVRMDEVSLGVIASGLYFMNWLLAFRATDYFAAGLEASPGPALLDAGRRGAVLPGLAGPAVGRCVVEPARGLEPAVRARGGLRGGRCRVPGLQYLFHGAAGRSGLLLHVYPRLGARARWNAGARARLTAWRRQSPWVVGVLAWAGLGAIAFSTFRFNDDTLFPGYAALLPTLGTAAIIAAGFATTSGTTAAGPARLLTLGPVRHVGRISYSWYLWHWPPLVFAAAIWGKLSPLEGVAVLAASYLPAVLTNRLVEKPFLHSETLTRFPRKALALGGACTASSVALGLLLFAVTPTVPEAPEARVAGAAALENGHAIQKSAKAVHPTPREAEAKENRPQMYADGCHLDLTETKSPSASTETPLRYHLGALR
jgi:peptidoglycan/LPS O-acetylase OafA/YrhL